MQQSSRLWSVVLAGGDGARLSALTTSSDGDVVPKQYCSLGGGDLLLQRTVTRARSVCDTGRICAVVAAPHRRWWQQLDLGIEPPNLIVQPQNRGTGLGMLLPVLHIARRDPSANVVFLPSDHHVANERVLTASMRDAAALLEPEDAHQVVLLGIEPEDPDPELGYIVPAARSRDGASHVAQFIEKPSVFEARRAIAQGALWNAFILVASVRTLLAVFNRKMPEAVAAMTAAIADESGESLRELYAGSLMLCDFSRDVMPGMEPLLRVLTVPRCGWTDLGTPRRVHSLAGRPHDARVKAAGMFPDLLARCG